MGKKSLGSKLEDLVFSISHFFRGCPNDHNVLPINPEWIICQRRDQVRRPAREPASLIRCTLLAMPEAVSRKPWYTEVNRNSTTHAERRPLPFPSPPLRRRRSRPMMTAVVLALRSSRRRRSRPMMTVLVLALLCPNVLTSPARVPRAFSLLCLLQMASARVPGTGLMIF